MNPRIMIGGCFLPVAAVATSLAVAVPAHAAPLAPTKAAAVKAPASLNGRLARSITKNGAARSAKDVLDTEFDGTESVTLANGKKIGLQDLLDRIGEAEAKAQSSASSLAALPRARPTEQVPRKSSAMMPPTTPQSGLRLPSCFAGSGGGAERFTHRT